MKIYANVKWDNLTTQIPWLENAPLEFQFR